MSDSSSKQILKNTKIVLFASHKLIKESLQILLENSWGAKVSASTNDCLSLPKLVEKNQPTLVILCLTNDDTKSVEIIAELKKESSPVLAIADSDDTFNQRRALQLGVSGIVSKEKEAKILLQAIKHICAGEKWFDKKSTAQLLEHKLWSEDGKPEYQDKLTIKTLTDREREVVSMVGEGLKSKEIAIKLEISKATVRHHLSSIYEKLGINDKLNLVIFAHRYNLVKSIKNKS